MTKIVKKVVWIFYTEFLPVRSVEFKKTRSIRNVRQKQNTICGCGFHSIDHLAKRKVNFEQLMGDISTNHLSILVSRY